MTISAMAQGMNAIRTGMQHLRRDAHAIATANGGTKNLVDPLLDLQEHKTNTLAATKIVKAADEMLGSIIDIKV